MRAMTRLLRCVKTEIPRDNYKREEIKPYIKSPKPTLIYTRTIIKQATNSRLQLPPSSKLRERIGIWHGERVASWRGTLLSRLNGGSASCALSASAVTRSLSFSWIVEYVM